MNIPFHKKPQSKTDNPETETKRKVLISFLSIDQDDWDFKRRDPAFMESFAEEPKNRHQIWRPSVALAQLKGLSFETPQGVAKDRPF